MPESFRVGNRDLHPCDPDPLDPRGFVWMWEQPNPRATYVIGCDPTFGIANWNRNVRTKDDARKDNAAIEVFRVGGDYPDVQVAEFAAPIDAIELAPICHLLGKLYGGGAEEGEALMCIEVYPGTGWMTQRELIQRFGYTNLPPWLVDAGVQQKATQKVGWHSSRSTRQDLWSRGVNHLERKMALLRSPWLIDEMADCTPDSFMSLTGRARNGLHDDRVVAALIALWYANEWSLAIEPTERAEVEPAKATNWQSQPISADQMMEAWNERFDDLMSE